MTGRETAAHEPDWHEEVERCSELYNVDKWRQPRSMVQVQLAKLKEETRCPICFGKIRSARISMVCLHRYCAKCIEQYLRTNVPGRHGDDKPCPVCRAHLHSRRATKPDPMFDKIIQALYGDVDQYDAEEEELIAQDNVAHVASWQVQLAEMKARQAAATAAARLAGAPPAAAGEDEAADEALHPGSTFGPGGGAAARFGAGGGGGLGGRTHSLADLQRQGSARDGRLPRLNSLGDMDEDGARPMASLHKADRAAAGGAIRGGSGQLGNGRLHLGKLGSPAGLKRETSSLAIAAAAAAADGGAGGRKKKKISGRQAALQILGVAARAAAAAVPQHAACCVVHLLLQTGSQATEEQQQQQQQSASWQGRQGQEAAQPAGAGGSDSLAASVAGRWAALRSTRAAPAIRGVPDGGDCRPPEGAGDAAAAAAGGGRLGRAAAAGGAAAAGATHRVWRRRSSSSSSSRRTA
ncbi:hypothetical protein COO60DRAFT_136590 [Scenedesmus sp. NREL 46B-D3]|nr:hypothetical protein COO60DRAFT_136590 [Scenedesmus sp. NREL 46B-D3]